MQNIFQIKDFISTSFVSVTDQFKQQTTPVQLIIGVALLALATLVREAYLNVTQGARISVNNRNERFRTLNEIKETKDQLTALTEKAEKIYEYTKQINKTLEKDTERYQSSN